MPSSKSHRPRTMAEQIADLADATLRDFDPEDIGLDNDSSDNSKASDSEQDLDYAAREHYEVVGKSKLRKPVQASLGAAYHGSCVSRDAFEESEEDDPFGEDFSSSSDAGDNALNGTADLDSDLDMDTGDEEVSEDDEPQEESDSDVDVMRDAPVSRSNGTDNSDALRKLVLQDKRAVASALSNAAKTDIAKGTAIKQQRAAFDSLLNIRMKLQKALISSNTMQDAPELDEQDQAKAALDAAESAASRLWNTLESLKSSLYEARFGTKRKAVHLDKSSSLSTIWSHSKAYERDAKKQRNSNMDMWSSKTRAAANASQSRRLNETTQQTLSEVMASQLLDMPRLVAKTQIARSCAPLQAAVKKRPKEEDEEQDSIPIYDDADFYGPLLQALIAQRSSDTAALSAMNVSFATQSWQAAREVRTKKVVDTKASKGRRLRYTVHEKIQNIMTPDSSAIWSNRQCDELFASLHGAAITIGDQDQASDEEDRDIAAEGLRLFAT